MNSIEPLFENIKNYVKTSSNLFKIKAVCKTSEVVSTVVSHLIVFIVLSLFLLFASLAIAICLGNLLGAIYLGFLCVAAFYIMLGGVLCFLLHDSIKRKVSNLIISEFFKIIKHGKY